MFVDAISNEGGPILRVFLRRVGTTNFNRAAFYADEENTIFHTNR
jgi:hypothetical protein